MAERRMFAKTIIDSDAFLDMPQSSQLLYFHLAMRADDDGFINNPKSIMRNVKCNEDDLKLLAVKKFIIPFESGIVVIKHWKIHNYIRRDRYKETKYKGELSMLNLDENNAYTLDKAIGQPSVNHMTTKCQPHDNQMDTQDRLGKDRLGKDSITTTTSSSIEDKSCCSSDNIFTYFQQRGFVSISSMMAQDINALIEMYSLEEVKQAVDIADNNGKHTLSYVRGILEHRRAGITKAKDNKKELEEWAKSNTDELEGEPF